MKTSRQSGQCFPFFREKENWKNINIHKATLQKNYQRLQGDESLLYPEELNIRGLISWNEGTEESKEEAISLWEEAAEQDNVNAMLNLAIIYKWQEENELAQTYLDSAIDACKSSKDQGSASHNLEKISIQPGGRIKNLELINQFFPQDTEQKKTASPLL